MGKYAHLPHANVLRICVCGPMLVRNHENLFDIEILKLAPCTVAHINKIFQLTDRQTTDLPTSPTIDAYMSLHMCTRTLGSHGTP